MSTHHSEVLASRLAEYVEQRGLSEILVVFHGGEPLLMGSEGICDIAHRIRDAVPGGVRVDFSLQTNGLVLREKDVELFGLNQIGVSLSLDGPRKSTDLHRLTQNGSSSFDRVMRAYEILKKYPDVFTGVISVIDSRVSPQELFTFFNEIDPPRLDFLLPDANYQSPPAFKDKLPGVYQQWLCQAFDLWLDTYSHIPVRFFDNLVAAIAGSQSGTDAFGFGDVSLLSIETDGTYHDLDVLKITKDNFSDLGMKLDTHSIYEASLSSKIQEHRKLLSLNGACSTCKKCSVVDVCAGGSVPHRYDGEGFDNPTIYCSEMFSLINHAKRRMKDLLSNNQNNTNSIVHHNLPLLDVALYNQEVKNEEFQKVLEHWIAESKSSFESALLYASSCYPEVTQYTDAFKKISADAYNRLVMMPYIHLWSYVANQQAANLKVFDLDGEHINLDTSLLKKVFGNPSLVAEEHRFYIHEDNSWLRKPFGKQVTFDNANLEQAMDVTLKALEVIRCYKPSLYKEMLLISPCIQFIQDPTAHPEKLVSFSDNIVPGALYVCIRLNNDLADPYDIAESLIHEHRHQKLYLLEKFSPVIVSEIPYVSSPWREEPRPVSGLFHAVFVFAELQSYWASFTNQQNLLGSRAQSIVKKYGSMLDESLQTLKSTKLTSLGNDLLKELEKIINNNAHLVKEDLIRKVV